MPFEFIDFRDPLFYVTYGLVLLFLLVIILFIALMRSKAKRVKVKTLRYNNEAGEALIFNGKQVFHIYPSGDTEVYTLLDNEVFRKGQNVFYHKDVKIVQVNDEDGVLVRNQSFEKIHIALDYDGLKTVKLGEKVFTRN